MSVTGDRALLEPDGINLTDPSSQHCRGRDAIRIGIAQAETTGLIGSTLLAILMSETLPRLVNVYGPANAALILARIAHEIRTGTAPNTTRQ
ncbi:hypothetical protein [Pseudorhodoplanes sinuspersici]|uniref:Uncharacterized protein n=1 Tax=Pseudorhodoplanes sinuspersici TaxID=1235591 RepID=A0A1W6ZVX7_9HYPH|nr:hypothetical protein [Pseudorhodoplanes sinuspersici]ARQ01470.1 hypothetical protein CAK95_21945 [Pseudorhodoplanes sinuspersici]RKE73163.1 hypothetical protein DFP91_1043 [Pseudorhodoplanes sinuspersici]